MIEDTISKQVNSRHDNLHLWLGNDQFVKITMVFHLKMKEIFGVDLYDAGLADKVCGYLQSMTAGTGAVRRTLDKAMRE